MAWVYQRKYEETRLGVWKIEEPSSFYQIELPGIAFNPNWQRKTDNKKLEWLASRYVLKQMMPLGKTYHLYKSHTGKPFFKDCNKNISFSHSKKYVAVIISEQRIGIDIQRKTPRIKSLAFKFLSGVERARFEERLDIRQLHVIWGAKEALYKVYNSKQLFFKRDIEINRITPQQIEAKVKFENGEYLHQLRYNWLEDYLLVYVEK